MQLHHSELYFGDRAAGHLKTNGSTSETFKIGWIDKCRPETLALEDPYHRKCVIARISCLAKKLRFFFPNTSVPNNNR